MRWRVRHPCCMSEANGAEKIVVIRPMPICEFSQITPTPDTEPWYKERESDALKGIVYEPDLTFAPAGKFYNNRVYIQSKKQRGATFAFVYAPNHKTSIRAGAGIYYDHFGQGLINVYDQNISFGLSNSVTNPAATKTIESFSSLYQSTDAAVQQRSYAYNHQLPVYPPHPARN